MTHISKSLTSASLVSGKLRSVLSYVWSVYSAPSVVGRHVWTLIALCLAVAVATAGLLFYWLSETLRYDPRGSAAVAGIYGAAVLVLLLCHPLRCVATVGLLTLFTKQGRKLVVSTSFVVVLFNVVPNITVNVGAALRVLKCTSESFARSLLNSSDILNRAKCDLVKETMQTIASDFQLVHRLRKLDNFMHIDLSEVKSRFTNFSREIESNSLHARDLVKDYKLLLNRTLAALFIILLIFQSARYLQLYLTSLTFENDYLSEESIKQLPDSSVGKNGSSKATRIRAECRSCVMSVVVVTLYFTAMTFIMVLDHMVFHIVHASLPWLLDIPSTSASITITFTTWSFTPAFCLIPSTCVKQQLTHFQRDYSWTFSNEPSLCHVDTSPPDVGVRVLLAVLWLLSYCLVLLEVLARRLRRRVAASFFPPQAERRAAFLVEKLRAKHKKMQQQEIFSVSVACV